MLCQRTNFRSTRPSRRAATECLPQRVHQRTRRATDQSAEPLKHVNITNGVDHIRAHCVKLRSQVDLEAETRIELIHKSQQELIDEIDEYERRCVEDCFVFDSASRQHTALFLRPTLRLSFYRNAPANFRLLQLVSQQRRPDLLLQHQNAALYAFSIN